MLVMRRRSAFSSCFDGNDDDGPLLRPCSTSSMMTPHDNVGLGRRWTLAGRRLESGDATVTMNHLISLYPTSTNVQFSHGTCCSLPRLSVTAYC